MPNGFQRGTPGGFPRDGGPRDGRNRDGRDGRGGRGGRDRDGRDGRDRDGRDRFPRDLFPRRQRRFPRFFIFPNIYGFPRDRCYWIDQYGRCCDRNGRCCDPYGRCEYYGPELYTMADRGGSEGGWYGTPGSWDMMPEMIATSYNDDDDEY